ncbi:MAG: DUF6390 family protein [Nakamurella sp.]
MSRVAHHPPRAIAKDPPTPSATGTAAGEAMFARYAYPPNVLGYCGSGDGHELLEFADRHQGPDPSPARPVDIGQRARTFDGAWPYLEHLAAVCGADSAMEARVVEAYWVGNELLESGDDEAFASAVRTAFGGERGTDLEALETSPRPVAHHSFHVFAVYPWVGILRRTGAQQALEVLDRCRIRWGRVDAVDGAEVRLQSRPLTWDGSLIGLGAPRSECARLSVDGRSLTTAVQPGDWIALHWDWVCDRLTPTQLAALRRFTARQLAITNRAVSIRPPAAFTE